MVDIFWTIVCNQGKDDWISVWSFNHLLNTFTHIFLWGLSKKARIGISIPILQVKKWGTEKREDSLHNTWVSTRGRNRTMSVALPGQRMLGSMEKHRNKKVRGLPVTKSGWDHCKSYSRGHHSKYRRWSSRRQGKAEDQWASRSIRLETRDKSERFPAVKTWGRADLCCGGKPFNIPPGENIWFQTFL